MLLGLIFYILFHIKTMQYFPQRYDSMCLIKCLTLYYFAYDFNSSLFLGFKMYIFRFT